MAYNGGYEGGGGGGGGGGGFMYPSQGGGGGSQDQDGAGKSFGKDTIRPVTIKMINEVQHDNPDSEFKIDGVDVRRVTFIGQIRNVSKQATNHTYQTDDGTGHVEVKEWIDVEAQAASAFGDFMDTTGDDGSDPKGAKRQLTEGQYVRVFGELKAFNDRKHVGARVIRPIEDFNEVQYHLLEAAVVHLHFTRGPPNGGVKTEDGAGGMSTGAAVKMEAGRYTPLQAKLLHTMRALPANPEGWHVNELAVKAKMEVRDVQMSAEELRDMGDTFETMDEYTFGLT